MITKISRMDGLPIYVWGSTRERVELRNKEDLKTTISRVIICRKPFHNILDCTELLDCMKTTTTDSRQRTVFKRKQPTKKPITNSTKTDRDDQ